MSPFAPTFCRSPRALVVLLVLLASPHAHAYLDPGTGSYLLQLAAAGILASMFTIRMYWTKVKDWFRALFAPKVPPAETKEEPEPPAAP